METSWKYNSVFKASKIMIRSCTERESRKGSYLEGKCPLHGLTLPGVNAPPGRTPGLPQIITPEKGTLTLLCIIDFVDFNLR